ncbi:pogo transposable element with KRAB [Trichonephila clavipes]|nr:pogo transposable element with KRAB [Trichonephila clavipes]
MDEVPLSFDIPPTRTVDVQGASSIPINTTGNERTSFTVFYAVLQMSASAKIAIIPGGLTKKLQPLDVGINRSFKSKVRKLWEQWMSDGEKNYTKTGKLKRASYENVSCWVLKAWNDVAETTVKNAFRKCNIVVKNYSDDEESLLSSDSDVLREDLTNLFIS